MAGDTPFLFAALLIMVVSIVAKDTELVLMKCAV